MIVGVALRVSLRVCDSVSYGRLLVALLERQSLTGLVDGPDGRLCLRTGSPCSRPGLVASQPPQPGRQQYGL